MADWDFIIAPANIAVEIKLDEVAISVNSLKMLNADGVHDGLHEWIGRTHDDMSEERRKMNDTICGFLDHLCVEAPEATFPAFITALKDIDAAKIPSLSLTWFRDQADYPGDEIVLNDRQAYLDFAKNFLEKKYGKKGEDFPDEHWSEHWEYLQNPEQILTDTIEHLQFMWDTYLDSEWQRVKPMLQEAVDAFSAIDYSNMGAYDAIETVAGRNMRGRDFFEERLEKAEKLIFMPSAHLGPYISWGATNDDLTMLFFFGARPPKNAKVKSTALSRSELLVRLNALADETRLKMLELLTEKNELCAQDFINALDLSQSSASRHLRQLTASGYISERRRDVAKCYSLNPERIDDTIHALKTFLKKN